MRSVGAHRDAERLERAAAELTRLRSAPPVTEEMVERAANEFWLGAPTARLYHDRMRRALTAALMDGGK